MCFLRWVLISLSEMRSASLLVVVGHCRASLATPRRMNDTCSECSCMIRKSATQAEPETVRHHTCSKVISTTMPLLHTCFQIPICENTESRYGKCLHPTVFTHNLTRPHLADQMCCPTWPSMCVPECSVTLFVQNSRLFRHGKTRIAAVNASPSVSGKWQRQACLIPSQHQPA